MPTDDLLRSIPIDTLEHNDQAINYCASALAAGELSVLTGAGISYKFKLPLWYQLVQRCFNDLGLEPSQKLDRTTPSTDLLAQLWEIEAELENRGRGSLHDFADIVSKSLYKQVKHDSSDDEFSGRFSYELLTDPTLIAIGALSISSKRGSVAHIINLNFDDLLEWYMEIHGFKVQSIQRYPSLERADVDVVIHHPHGFLPLRSDRANPSDFLILSERSYLESLADPLGPIPTFLRSVFLSKVVLFVGTSMSDIDLKVSLKHAQKLVDDERPLGFVMTSKNALDSGRKKELRSLGLRWISFESVDEIPNLLLEICRRSVRSRYPN